MTEKVIVTDCDGVLLNWEYAFDIWMNEKGHYKKEDSEFMYSIGERYGITISSLDHFRILGLSSQYNMNLRSHNERYVTLVGSPLYLSRFLTLYRPL